MDVLVGVRCRSRQDAAQQQLALGRPLEEQLGSRGQQREPDVKVLAREIARHGLQQVRRVLQEISCLANTDLRLLSLYHMIFSIRYIIYILIGMLCHVAAVVAVQVD